MEDIKRMTCRDMTLQSILSESSLKAYWDKVYCPHVEYVCSECGHSVLMRFDTCPHCHMEMQ